MLKHIQKYLYMYNTRINAYAPVKCYAPINHLSMECQEKIHAA